MKKFRLIPIILIFTLLLIGCNTVPPIETMPYPEAARRGAVSGDYIAYRKLSELWDAADYIIVGKYKNVAPWSYNAARDMNDYSKPSTSLYLENLIYQFQVEAVLKGTPTKYKAKDVIEVAQFHGFLVDGEVSTTDTYVQPDTGSYKILFLETHESVDYYFLSSLGQWLSTVQLTRRSNWENCSFALEGRTFDPQAEDWLEKMEEYAEEDIFTLDMEPSGQRAAGSIRTTYTGAELLTLAEQMEQSE